MTRVYSMIWNALHTLKLSGSQLRVPDETRQTTKTYTKAAS